MKLKPVIGLKNSVGLDRARVLFRQGIATVGVVQVKKSAHKKGGQLLKQQSGYLISRVREYLSQKIEAMPLTNGMHDLLKGITLGDKRGISQDTYGVFQRTGTSHLLAISGLHVSMAAGMAWLIAGFFWSLLAKTGRVSKQGVQMGAAIVFSICYAGLSGFALPTIRACIMSFCACVYAFSYRLYSPWQAWSLALMMICLLDPLAVLSPGLVLSFGSVAGLLMLYTCHASHQHFILNHFKTAAWLFVLMMPLSLIFFQQVSLISYLANLIAIPWMMCLVLPVALLGAIFLPISASIAHGLMSLASLSIAYLFKLLAWFASWPWVVWFHALPAVWVGCAGLVAVALLLLPRPFPGKYFIPLLLIPMLLHSQDEVGKKQLKVQVIDIGQGLSVLIQTQRHQLLFDAGPTRTGGGLGGRDIIVPLLLHWGIDKIDRVIISHGDDDHQGGLAEILKVIPAKVILSGEPKKLLKKGIQSKPCHDGQHWQWDGVDFRVLHPTKRSKGGNNRSCVLQIALGKTRLLLPGDLEKKGEMRVLNRYGKQLKSDLLLAGHHGSKSSSSQAFLNQVKPRWVIYSAGYWNRYGFPHEIVRNRYSSMGVKQYNTADLGQMTWVFDEKGLVSFDTFSNHAHALWY